MKTTKQIESGAVYLNARGYLYRLLANLFSSELTPEFILDFQEGGGREILDSLAGLAECPKVVARLTTSFSTFADPQQDALDLAEAFSWLFHGVAGPHSAPPYASVYLSQSGSTHQQVEADLQALLQEHALCFANQDREPCDHVSIILEFISWLVDNAETSGDSEIWISKQKNVVEKYLLSWLPEFSDRCRHNDRHGFYAALAEDLYTFVAADYQQLSDNPSKDKT